MSLFVRGAVSCVDVERGGCARWARVLGVGWGVGLAGCVSEVVWLVCVCVCVCELRGYVCAW